MIISPTFGWKKVLGKCCLIVLGGITRLTTKTHIGSTSYFGTCFVVLRSSVWSYLETNLVWVSTITFLLKISPIMWQTTYFPFHQIIQNGNHNTLRQLLVLWFKHLVSWL
jgi:hypothetical protein